MIASVHIADVGARLGLEILRRAPRPSAVAGLRYAETAVTAPLSESLLPRPNLGRVGLIATWDSDAALDEFSRRHPLAERLRQGWEVRLEPLRVSGAWPQMPDLPARERAVKDDQPVAVLTLGRLRLPRALPFLRSGARAESQALRAPELLASTGFARPPRLVCTFSIWQSAAAMRLYAYREGGAHQAAVANDRARPFHRESAFVRFRPYAASGRWDGRDPLAGTA